MKLGIMQPYFFPYIEYFRLIAQCDLWISFDTVRYNRKSWISRNRIINREKGWTYIGVPIKRGATQLSLREALIDDGEDWRKAFFDKLRVYRSTAPHYDEAVKFFATALTHEYSHLAGLNAHIIRSVCGWLDIRTRIECLADMKLDLPEACAPGEWALHIAKAVGADLYLNASGGVELFDRDLYTSEGVQLAFHEHKDITYNTHPFEYVPDLSIIDPIMWLGRERLQELVR